MKVPAPCAVALTLFHLVSGLPAPGAAPGELDITKYGRDVNGAHVLHPRQGPVVSVSIPPQATDRSSTKATSAASSTSDPPDTSSSCAYQPFVVYQGSQFSPFPSFKYERTTFVFFRDDLGSNVQV